MPKIVLQKGIVTQQEIVSDRVVPVPTDGHRYHKVKRIRILTLGDIIRILASPVLGLLKPEQIEKIEGRRSRLERR